MSDGNGQAPAETLELIRGELKGLRADQGKIKLREWDDLEDKAGREVSPWVGHEHPPIWFMQGVLWLWLRRKHPTLTFEDFGELDLEDLDAAKGGEGAELDPTDAKPEQSSSPASATSGA